MRSSAFPRMKSHCWREAFDDWPEGSSYRGGDNASLTESPTASKLRIGPALVSSSCWLRSGTSGSSRGAAFEAAAKGPAAVSLYRGSPWSSLMELVHRWVFARAGGLTRARLSANVFGPQSRCNSEPGCPGLELPPVPSTPLGHFLLITPGRCALSFGSPRSWSLPTQLAPSSGNNEFKLDELKKLAYWLTDPLEHNLIPIRCQPHYFGRSRRL